MARVWQDGTARIIEVRGQTARALLALVMVGEHGCTALEVSDWAFRFAAYCHELRHRYGLVIRTDREDHPGGWHGRHVLETPVEILSIEGLERWPSAA
ncbi:MAG: hypothetical protein GY789_10495 [Hyphomicrobiales bacterium]|nr:hypothetical protein [Hyphomicrobiales bacterium]